MVRRSGFTILELSVALAIAGIVVAAAASTGVTVSRLLKLEAKKSQADADSRRLVDFVLTNLQGVGGGPVRPWMGTWLEQQGCLARNGLPPCLDNDRLTLVNVDMNRSSCIVDAVTPTMIDFRDPDPGAPCCYAWDGTPDDGPVDQYVGMALMLVNGPSRWAVVVATSELDPLTCQYGLSGIEPLSAWTGPVGAAPIPGNEIEAAFPSGSSVTPIVLRTLFIESDGAGQPGLPRLVEWQDGGASESDGLVNSAEVRLVFPGVVRFHVALGFDSAPFDGSVTETGGTNDEWFGNAADDTLVGLVPTGLRMAEVGVVSAVGAVDPGPRTLQVLDGAPFSSDRLMLRRAKGRTMLRNIAMFF